MPETEQKLQKKLVFLAVACKQQIPFPDDHQIKFYPGSSLVEDNKAFPTKIKGTFGMVYTTACSRVIAARLGFNVYKNFIDITNSPQGKSREDLKDCQDDIKKEVFSELRKGSFRERLMRKLIVTSSGFSGLGIKVIRGVSAENHPRVNMYGGVLPLDIARKSMDDLYKRMGFLQGDDGNYYLPLKGRQVN